MPENGLRDGIGGIADCSERDYSGHGTRPAEFVHPGKRDMTGYGLQRLLVVVLLGSVSILAQPASAAGKKFFAYNMTTRTDFTGVYLAPAGTTNWGPNQALNDPDKSLDTTERLTLTNLEPSHYDLKLVARNGRTCIVKNVDLTKKNSFEIKQAQLTDCR